MPSPMKGGGAHEYIGESGAVGLVVGPQEIIHAGLRINDDPRHVYDALVVDLHKTLLCHLSFPSLLRLSASRAYHVTATEWAGFPKRPVSFLNGKDRERAEQDIDKSHTGGYTNNRKGAIIVDTETGVNYLLGSHNKANGTGLTVLVDRDGKPIVTPVE